MGATGTAHPGTPRWRSLGARRPAAAAGGGGPFVDAYGCNLQCLVSSSLTGALALSRPLMQALDLYGASDGCQQPLLATIATILAQPRACQLAAVRGGDADPEAAQALLSVLGCCVRQARQWQSIPAPAAIEAVLHWGLPLAASNTGCNHRDTALQAVATLSAVLALILDPDTPLHAALLGFAAQQGPTIMRGLLLALLSLSAAGSSLPKVRHNWWAWRHDCQGLCVGLRPRVICAFFAVARTVYKCIVAGLSPLQVVSLMSDTALLAAALAIAEQKRQQEQAGSSAMLSADECSAAANRLLESWLPGANAAIVGSGLFSGESLAAMLLRWDWQPVVQQAAVQLLPADGTALGSSMSVVEARRAMQRSMRMVADFLRRQP